MPLEDRREILQQMISTGGHILSSEATPGVYHLVDQRGREGMVSKLKGSAYQSGKTTAWRKIKCFEEKQMDIIGVQRERGKAASDHG